MNKSFFGILPLTVAVLFATSCSKDESNGKEPENVVSEGSVVKIPFSVKVNQGKPLTHIVSESTVPVSLTDDDVTKGITLTVTGTGIKESSLILENQGGSYVFSGDIELSEEYKEQFESGQIKLTGSFGVAQSEVRCSTVSLADLIENSSHLYLATFASNAASIDLYEQNSYIEFTVAKGQYKVYVNNGWYPTGNEKINQELNKLWVIVPSGAVSGNFIKADTKVAAGKIYTVTSTDVIDLGLPVLWKTTNETSGTATSHGPDPDYPEYVYERYYTWENACAFGTLEHPNGASSFRLPSKEDFAALIKLCADDGYVLVDGMKCKEFSSDKGAVYFPASGDGSYHPGHWGSYWSGTAENNYAYRMIINTDGGWLTGVDGKNEYSVRLVQDL